MPKTFGVLLESELHAREGMGGKVCWIGLRIGEILLMDCDLHQASDPKSDFCEDCCGGGRAVGMHVPNSMMSWL